MGKILAIQHPFVKFVGLFYHQSFVVYGNQFSYFSKKQISAIQHSILSTTDTRISKKIRYDTALQWDIQAMLITTYKEANQLQNSCI